MKNLKKNHWIMLVVAVQVAALAAVAIKREWIHGNGETVYLRTAPVDPRDLFRGDYVQLDYEIGQPETALLPPAWQNPETLHKQPYQQVYLQLQRDARGIGSGNEFGAPDQQGAARLDDNGLDTGLLGELDRVFPDSGKIDVQGLARL